MTRDITICLILAAAGIVSFASIYWINREHQP